MGESDFFSTKGKVIGKRIWESNFIQNCPTFKLEEWSERGAGGCTIFFELGNNVQAAHISEFPVGTYKKAHRHGPGARIVLLSGQGYSLIWPEGGKRLKIDWRKNSLFSPPDQWFHQHFNTGKEPARYMALSPDFSYKFKGFGKREHEGSDKSIKEGGRQIEYTDEDPEIRRLFKAELAKTGATWHMGQFFPGE